MLRILLEFGCKKEWLKGDMVNEELLVEAVVVEEVAMRETIIEEVVFEGYSLQDGLLKRYLERKRRQGITMSHAGRPHAQKCQQ